MMMNRLLCVTGLLLCAVLCTESTSKYDWLIEDSGDDDDNRGPTFQETRTRLHSGIGINAHHEEYAADDISNPNYMTNGALQIFHNTDLNSDGYITMTEYVRKNKKATIEELEILFQVYDNNGDRLVSLAEFLEAGDVKYSMVEHDVVGDVGAAFPESHKCDTAALENCALDFIDYLQTRGRPYRICDALQLYSDCIASHSMKCHTASIDQYKKALFEVDRIYQEQHICSNIEFDELIAGGIISISDLSSADGCGARGILGCGVDFVGAVQDTSNHDICHSLHNYRSCIHKNTRECNDLLTTSLFNALQVVSKAYRKAKICYSEKHAFVVEDGGGDDDASI